MSKLVESQADRLCQLGFENVNIWAGTCEIVRGEEVVRCAVDFDKGKYWVSVAWKWRGHKAPEPPKFRFCVDSGAAVPSWKLDKLFALGREYVRISQEYADAAEAEAQKAKAFREETSAALRPVFLLLSESVPETWDEAENLGNGFHRSGGDGAEYRKFQAVRYLSGAENGKGYCVSIAAGGLTAEQVAALGKAFAEILGKEGE